MPDNPLRPLRIHVVSETPFLMKGQGVHTAFVDNVDMLQHQPGVEVVVNEDGWGDLFHAHSWGPYLFWKGRRYPGRRVFTVHVTPDSIRGSLPGWRLLMPLVRWYFRKVYSYADVCIAISPMVEEAIRDSGARTRIVRIVNPVLTERFHASAEQRAEGRRRLGLSEDAFVVLGVGQLEGRKGVDDFLEVAAACPEYTFVWVGGRPFGPMTEGIGRLNRKIAAAGPHVRFPGAFELEEMPLVYNAADLLLFPSYQENCPLVPLEAAACGLPIVFRDIVEIARLYEASYLKARDIGGFVELTRRMATQPSFRKYGQALSRRLIAQFDKEAVRTKLLALYAELAGRELPRASAAPTVAEARAAASD